MSLLSASGLAVVVVMAARALAGFIRTSFEGPVRYRMRGPGPKWREKHMFDVTTRGA